jgi:uncharacterized protein (TIGR02145 family)
LNVTKYRNGDLIPQVTDATQWTALTTGAWCYYNNDPAMAAIYGKLYNWDALIDGRGIAPKGYHIPTDTDWAILTTCLGGDSIAGSTMKETGNTHWANGNTDATNSRGFTGLPGGTQQRWFIRRLWQWRSLVDFLREQDDNKCLGLLSG